MPKTPLAPHSAAAALRTPDFDEQLHEQLRKAPWVLASIGLHGLVALVFLMLPPAPPSFEARHIITATLPADLPPELAPDPPDPVQKTTDEEILRPESEVVIDAPITPNDGDPGAGEDDEIPAGDPLAQNPVGIDSVGTNPTIGIGGNVGGPWGLRGTGLGGDGTGGGSRRRQEEHGRVTDALDWFKRHQSPDGRWDSDGFSAQCTSSRCSGPGDATHDPGVTGLALLTFLGRGETHHSGPFKETVKNGLRYLKNIQDTEGCFGPRTSQQFQYDHSIATLAMAEAYGMTMSAHLRDAAQRGVAFIQQSRNPYMAWRYGVRDGDNDTSMTGWMVMALKSAKLAELEVEDSAFRDAIGWVEKMTEPEFGKVGYQQRGGPSARTVAMKARFPAEHSEAMTAAGVLVRIFAGEDPSKSEPVQKGLALLSKKLPRWDPEAGTIDMYYWYYGTLAAFQGGGETWKKWNAAMKPAIADTQRSEKDRCEHGSWDPEDPWAPEGGRVYSTALMALCLEVYERYPRVAGLATR